ncbi:putative phosphonate metabolism protein [Rhizobium skierniewicense]|uniref:Putative phosphonate metabolism protein n=1 Tax=Rhizobium skierniewicense TaxID=984260 RepID=A0A7W6C6N3_9HYPH|nr:DUF1045 domain-containing protein [Rhizobium skierniewicense]MBB3946733.1 putative phosphonate metabolism protein [Rhizobium skierniewicense]
MRYAIYFTPAKDDPLTETASRWLGRDAFTGARHDEHAAYANITADPCRYGFHATLKAPFELAADRSETDLLTAFRAFAGNRQAFAIPTAVIGTLGPFFAFVPDRVHQPLQDFAADVVRYFEPFRAPLSESDIARRRPQNLTESERQNLTRWGYPHVMDDFRFHMTLTGPVPENHRSDVASVLHRKFAEFTGRPLTISGLGLFVEPTRGDDFTVHTWLPLTGSAGQTHGADSANDTKD